MSDKITKINKYFASIYLAMIGDKIGFGDGEREMNYMKEMISMDQYNVKNIITGLTNLILFKFISEGGVTAIDINALSVSDDTIMHFGTIIGLLTEYSNKEDFDSEAMIRINTAISKWMPFVTPVGFDSKNDLENNDYLAIVKIIMTYSVPNTIIKERLIEINLSVI